MSKAKLDYTPSHVTEGDYAVLMETNGEQSESWYYFIRVEGNEETLQFLQKQLEDIEWYVLDDYSTFDLEMDHFVSARTAKEMTKLDLNYTSFHRKFDGALKPIDFNFKKKESNDRKIKKVFKTLGYGKIEDFIDDEDLDEEDLASDFEGTDYESIEGDDETSSSDDDEEDEEEYGVAETKSSNEKKNKYKIPPMLMKK